MKDVVQELGKWDSITAGLECNLFYTSISFIKIIFFLLLGIQVGHNGYLSASNVIKTLETGMDLYL